MTFACQMHTYRMRGSTVNMFNCLLLLISACKLHTSHGLFTLQRVRARVMQGERVPVIHTVGFFAEEQRGGPGERFLRQLSALTGGTFQVSFLLILVYILLCCAVLGWAVLGRAMACTALHCALQCWPPCHMMSQYAVLCPSVLLC